MFEQIEKLKKIKMVLTDVDGVLTDGAFYYSEHGESMKRFFVQDGMGVTLLKRAGIPTIIVTKEISPITQAWTRNMNIEKVFQGIKNKEKILDDVKSDFSVEDEEIAYIGDDVNDIPLLTKVGFSACPNNANGETKKICDYICKNNGGKGAFREIVDMILQTKD